MSAATVAGSVGMASSSGLFGSIGDAVFPLAKPSMAEVHAMYWAGCIGINNAMYYTRQNGLVNNRDDWNDADFRVSFPIGAIPGIKCGLKPGAYSAMNIKASWFRSSIPLPSIHEASEMFKRGTITQDLYDHYVWTQCGSNMGMTRAWQDMRFELGGPTDWIRFAVRESFTPELLQKFGYTKEFPKAITPYLTWLGLDKPLGLPIPPGATNDDGTPKTTPVTVMDLHWWSHWELPSNTQGYEMLHRLYGESRFGRSPGVDDDTVFNPADLEMLQKANDIPDYWRKRLQAISYNPLTRVDIRRMYDVGVIKTDAELYHAYRKIGYDDVNAMHLVNFTQEKARPKLKNFRIIPLNELCDAYSYGFITREVVELNLTRMGYPENQILIFIAQCDTKRQIKHNKLVLKYIRDNFLYGYVDDVGSRAALVQMEMRTDSINKFLSEWRYEKNIKTKYLASKDWLDFYENYVITEEDCRTKLINLGHTNLDITRMISLRKRRMTLALTKQVTQSQKEQARKQAQALKEQERKKKEQQREIEKIKQQSMKEANERTKKILGAFTDKNLVSFYKNKILNTSDIEQILQARGWNSTAQIGWIRSYIDPNFKKVHQPPEGEEG